MRPLASPSAVEPTILLTSIEIYTDGFIIFMSFFANCMTFFYAELFLVPFMYDPIVATVYKKKLY